MPPRTRRKPLPPRPIARLLSGRRAIRSCALRPAWLPGWLLLGLLTGLLALLPAAPVRAQTFTADSSSINATIYPWIDISSTGTTLALGDDDISATLPIGFSFTFGGTTHTGFRVMTNGQVQFGGTDTSYAPSPLPLDGNSGNPNIDAVMFALWDDLYPNSGEIKYRTLGTAPNRVLVVSWINAKYYCTSGSGCSANRTSSASATFQVQIYEQGYFVYRYGTTNGSGGAHTSSIYINPAGALAGYELSNTDFVQFSYQSAVLTNGTTIVWTRSPTALMEMRFDERRWNGTALEVTDSSGNAYHGTAGSLSATRPSTRAISPAMGTTSGTCSYGSFTRANKDHVSVRSTFPNLGSTGTNFTVTAWIRTTDNSLPNQRIVIDDENNTGGFGLSLGDNGTGILKLLSRGLPSSTSMNTGAVINSNTWYFVVAAFNFDTKVKIMLVYNTSGTLVTSVSSTFTEATLGADSGIVTIGGESNTATENTSNVGFSGDIDEVRIHAAVLTPTQLNTLRTTARPCAAQLMARYRMDELGYNGSAGELTDDAGYGGGPYSAQGQGSPVPSAVPSYSGARTGSTGTCGYASFAGPTSGGGHFRIDNLPVPTTTGARTSVSFWMYWTGTASGMPVGFQTYDLVATPGHFGFNTAVNDVYGIADTGLANTWVHVVAVFANGGVTNNKLYINGVLQTLSQRAGTPSAANAVASSTLRIGAWGNDGFNRFIGRIDEVQVYAGELSAAEVSTLYNETHACPAYLNRVQIEHASGSGLTCNANTLTVRACMDAGCTTPFTAGLTGSLTATGGTVNWPAGAAFSIPAGSSTTTVAMHQTSVGTTVLGTTGLSFTPTAGTTCNFGSPSCTFTAADAGLLFDVPDQLAETSVQVSVRAVRKSDNSLACTPAFANVTRSVTFRCSYTNPATGTLPVRIGGTALNAANSASAACDGTGRAVSLAFDATGTAATSAQYADVGRITLNATYTGSGADAGLSMTGSDSFVAAPFDFAVTGLSGATVAAGSPTTATVTARNYLGNATPNFGRESSPESVTLGFVRKSPTGAGAVSGSFSGTVGSFTNGVASSSNIAYTEVGQIDVVATLASSGYLGSAYRPAGSSHGAMVWCADEWNTCTLPAGTVNTVWYAAYTHGAALVQTGLSGSLSCTNAQFGDPWVGSPKGCWYVSTSGVHSGNTGALALRPHRFDLSATAACPAGGFTYAGQPYAVTVTARNAAGGTTVNYDGTAATSPNQARAVTLADANSLGLGTLSGGSIAASAFTAGVASASPGYAFTAKLTAPQTLVLRATDGQGTSSAAGTEPGMTLRSGRLRLSNAFGKSGSALQVPVTAEYWSGAAWVLNSADGCTTVPAAAVALSNPRDATGAATATATSVSAPITLAAGRGTLTLAAPTPANASLTLELALNLGSTAADLSCLAAHPATTGAARPWLRSAFGSCAATADRDPAARASFGVFSPETRKTVHLRELF